MQDRIIGPPTPLAPPPTPDRATGTRWLWDLCPLYKLSWGAWELEYDDLPRPDHRVFLRRYKDRDGQLGWALTLHEIGQRMERGAQVADFVVREAYVPNANDLELLKRFCPDADPYRPPWYLIKAYLVAADYDADLLDKHEAPVLLALLKKEMAKAIVNPDSTPTTPPTPPAAPPEQDEENAGADSTPPAAKPTSSKRRDLHTDPPDTIQELVFTWLRTSEHRKGETPRVADRIREAIRKAPGGPKIENACLVRYGKFDFETAQRLLAEVALGRGQTVADYLPLAVSTFAEYLPDAAREAILRDLKPSARKAYLAFQYAETMKERRLEDRTAYTWLCDNGIDERTGDLGELTDYELPLSFDTWGRQLRDARGRLGEQKHTRRAGRAAGSSIVRGDEIEYQRGDEE